MINLAGFRQPGERGAPPPRTDPPFFQQRGRLPIPPPSQPLSPPTDLSMTGGGPSLQTRPPAIPYNRPRTDIPMGGPDFPGRIPMGGQQSPLGRAPLPMNDRAFAPRGWEQLPMNDRAFAPMGTPQLPPWLQQRQPVQMGQPQWPQQTQLPPWLMQRQPYQMGQPQWPGMQQRSPWMRQQGGPGMAGRY